MNKDASDIDFSTTGKTPSKEEFARISEWIEETKQGSRDEYILQYNKELDEAKKRVDAGFFTSQEDLEKESENW